MWVHATLVDTALLVHSHWVRPLRESEQAAYYEDMKTCAQLFGTPPEVIPPTLSDFREYMSERLASEEIVVTDTAREIAQTVFRPPLPAPLRPAMPIVKLITAGLMPPGLRSGYELAWDPARAAGLRISREWTRRIAMPLLPGRLRNVPVSR
jgi:uncharacterized protein (DUF2236 family)